MLRRLSLQPVFFYHMPKGTFHALDIGSATGTATDTCFSHRQWRSLSISMDNWGPIDQGRIFYLLYFCGRRISRASKNYDSPSISRSRNSRFLLLLLGKPILILPLPHDQIREQLSISQRTEIWNNRSKRVQAGTQSMLSFLNSRFCYWGKMSNNIIEKHRDISNLNWNESLPLSPWLMQYSIATSKKGDNESSEVETSKLSMLFMEN